MSTYIIGDLQGCFEELQALLTLIKFDPKKDRLGFVGDLVNRGPDSLKILRFIKNLNNPFVVLGNHDLFLLIIGYNLMPEESYQHTLQDVLRAPDKLELLEWLRHQPLIRYESSLNMLLVHAGVPPQWTITQAIDKAHQIEQTLRGSHYENFLRDMFGNLPNMWCEELVGQERLRYITNALVRMRFCDQSGCLDLSTTNLVPPSSEFKPWFEWRDPSVDQVDILFGHWAALNGQSTTSHCYALDTGCAWGKSLTALRVEDKQRFSVPAKN